MTPEEYIKIVENKKGANLSAEIHKTLKTKKGFDGNITKITKMVLRGGVEYENIQKVQEKRENGELPPENQGLPWGEWAQFPFHITHKGSDYLRLYPASGINFIPKTEYFMDGVKVEKDQVKDYCYASEFRSDESVPDCFSVKAENLISLG